MLSPAMPVSRRPLLGLGCAIGALLLALATDAGAQARPERGLRHVDPRWHALTDATVVVRPGEVLEQATVVVRDGVIVAVGTDVVAPDGARIWDCTGLTIYAGLVEAYLEVDAPEPDPELPGRHWNNLVVPQRSALDGEGASAKLRKELRKLGFTAAAISPAGGLFRGKGAVVALSDGVDAVHGATAEVLVRDVYQTGGFDTQAFNWGSNSSGARYPTSEMGAIALMRQTLADADWHAACEAVYAAHPTRHEPPVPDDALSALARGGAALLFDARNELQALRAIDIAGEFKRPLVLLGSGTSFRRLDAIAAADVTVVAPVDFPEAPKVATLAEAERVSLRALMTWEQAPTNPRRLAAAGVDVVLTTHRLEKRADFHGKLRKAIEHGLDADAALAMVTTRPAAMLGLDDRLGQVAPGMLAHLVVVDGELFDEESEIRDVWVGGRRYEIKAGSGADHDGAWTISVSRLGTQLDVETTLTIDAGKTISFEARDDAAKARQVKLGEQEISFLLDGEDLGEQGVFAFSGVIEGDSMSGLVFGTHGRWGWSAVRQPAEPADDEPTDEPDDDGDDDGDGETESSDVPGELVTPLGAYGQSAMPPQESVLIEHATVWTASDAGIIEDGAVLVRDGKIAYVGPSRGALHARADRVIDGSGMHVTPGLIDCHSHTGMSAVNEAGQRVTAEVRARDVIDPDDINWYRQLAGGLTAANQLHGSANAVGGQNSVVKLRWGARHPRDMLLDGAPEGIKFALGENPKRVAANMNVSDEYPQTRMGVATLIRDRLSAGRDYAAEWARYEQLRPAEMAAVMPPRRDLELEAMGEIVDGTRLIHSHSYRQDEILSLCRIAQEFGVTIGTFQHVLEGYKVAETIAETALGGSTFSDWWAYKFEVIDAIPFNAAIMQEVGVTVSINSDSSEHARRLNTEAAKSVKYGGMAPHDALKLVTLNPAIQLAVADRIGSLEDGKDGDVVLWSGSPLSYTSRCEATFVDGRQLFSRERDRELRDAAAAERSRIIQKLIANKKSKKSKDDEAADAAVASGDPEDADQPLAGRDRWSDMEWSSGAMDPGDCGCDVLFQGAGSAGTGRTDAHDHASDR